MSVFCVVLFPFCVIGYFIRLDNDNADSDNKSLVGLMFCRLSSVGLLNVDGLRHGLRGLCTTKPAGPATVRHRSDH